MLQSYVEGKYLVNFFESLIRSDRFSEEAEVREEILRFLKSKTDLILDSDFDSIIAHFSPMTRQVLTPILTQLTTGRRGTEVLTKQGKPFYLLKNLQVYSSLGEDFASYWLSDYRKPLDKYQMNNPYYFISSQNDLKVWGSFAKSGNLFVGKNEGVKKEDTLHSWRDLIHYAHPFRDIIVNDRYCLKDKEGIVHNLIPMICNLAKYKDLVENVIFFVRPNELYTNSLEEVQGFLSEALKENGIETNIKIFTANRTPHDRMILTNNVFMTSGDSWDYFNSDGGLKTKGTEIIIRPIFEANRAVIEANMKIWKAIYSTMDDQRAFGKLSKNMIDT